MEAFKILVVDDEPDLELLLRQRFRKELKERKFEFVFAGNGQEALDKLSGDESIDLIMSDINMPVMDGLTFLLRLGDVNRPLKTVIVSAYGDMQNIRTAMNRGAYDFLMKPIDFDDFEVTIRKTRNALDEIKQGEQARHRLTAIQHELSVATRIQQSILPRVFPPFPDRKEFSIYASMTPARHVGGDFYDFFFIDDDRLGVVIGDVSGKGVPAAIFMAVSRTLIRATAMQGGAAADCLRYANSVLYRQSDPSMFVTIFYGILNTKTGQLEYSVGGHNPPYLVSAKDGARVMDVEGGMVVGILEKAQFMTETIDLRPGETIFLYTDGVTEAEDKELNPFSDERLLSVLENAKNGTVERMVGDVLADVGTHCAGAIQSDDITAMALRYEG
ncbi:MAG: SpoIIE family protein phosphatase [Candidatus Solibacter usitatus]|nr:SpoIIE family protein phosphatase [Candidatus Solibacter usitatus]